MKKHLFRLWYFLIVISLLLSAANVPSVRVAAASAPQTSGAWTKVLVQTQATQTRASLSAVGAELIETYGAFELWRVPAERAAAFANLPDANLAPEMDSIPLRGDLQIETQPGAKTAVLPEGLQQTRKAGQQLWLVQFVGPVKDAWLAELEKMGAQIVIYMPYNAYIIWADAATLQQIERTAAENRFIQWSGAYHPAYRLEPSLQELLLNPQKIDPNTRVAVTLQFYNAQTTETSLKRLFAQTDEIVVAPWQVLNFTNVSVTLRVAQLAEVAAWDDVVNVEPYVAPQKLDEIQGQILAGNITTSGSNIVPSGTGYLAWLTSKGFPTTPSSYPIVDVVDDGIDNGTATPLHADFYELGSTSNPDRLVYNANCTTDTLPNAVGGHGNLNLGIVGGYNNGTGYPNEDASGYNYGLGISPYTRLAGTKIFTNAGSFNLTNCSGTIDGLVLASYNNGASFTSNSWGAATSGAYNVDSQAYDSRTRDAAPAVAGNQEMLHIFAAGNSGSGANTVGAPGTAKNVLTVGATENVRDNGVADGCGETNANNADDIATFSSRGPTDDSRVKPDVMAPGTHVQGPASQDPGFNGNGVCGPSSGSYYPTSPAQTLYTWSSGTSHSTPAVAGAASLVWEYYGRVWTSGATPSPAMLKGLLLNTPRYLNGSGTGGTLPSNNQGWGDVNLGMLFDGSSRVLQDQTTTFANTGEFAETFAAVSNTALPFNVTLVWTDPAGATTGNSYVNNLDLEVIVDGVTYKGNVFSGATSVSGGTADVRNNVENVFLPAGTSGTATIRVIATNIAGDGVPGNADTTDQDFALIVYNGAGDPTFSINATPASLNVCAPADGSINVDVGSIYGFTDPVTLSVSGNPAGSSAAFSVNPVTPAGSSTLTIGNTGAATAGAYTLQIDGVSGATTRSDTVTLNLFSAAPAAPTLSNPASGSKSVAPNTSFSWVAVPNTQSYAIEIATDAAFSNIVASASGLVATTYTPGSALTGNTLYFWRVRAENTCGSGSYSTGAFVTANLSTLSSCNTPALAIPDNNPTGVSNDMVIASGGTLIDIDVSVRATHTYIGDLID